VVEGYIEQLVCVVMVLPWRVVRPGGEAVELGAGDVAEWGAFVCPRRPETGDRAGRGRILKGGGVGGEERGDR